jgi:hypothetical protein
LKTENRKLKKKFSLSKPATTTKKIIIFYFLFFIFLFVASAWTAEGREGEGRGGREGEGRGGRCDRTDAF